MRSPSTLPVETLTASINFTLGTRRTVGDVVYLTSLIAESHSLQEAENELEAKVRDGFRCSTGGMGHFPTTGNTSESGSCARSAASVFGYHLGHIDFLSQLQPAHGAHRKQYPVRATTSGLLSPCLCVSSAAVQCVYPHACEADLVE